VNTPLNNTDQPVLAEDIEVTDRKHPLFGRRFPILSAHDSSCSAGHVQYALKKRAIGLAWRADDGEVIDADLGFTGSEAAHREGFKELNARVTLGQIGIVLSSEVTRLSRNCSDWYLLLDICGYRGCLIADHDDIYDPATVNGRLVLGLTRTLSEMELHTISSRVRARIVNKAERGELALGLPTGLVRDEHGLVHKDPNLEVQDRISFVFQAFLRLRTAGQVLRVPNEGGLTLPRRDRRWPKRGHAFS